MAVQPAAARLSGGDSQTFTCDTPEVTWVAPGIGKIDTQGQVCVYTAPPKWQIWFSRDVILTALGGAQGSSSAVITLVSTPAWIAALCVIYAVLFVSLVLGVYWIWPPPSYTPWIDVSPPIVTLAPGHTQQFEARVRNVRDQSVTWSATAGLITPTGFFTPPAEPAPGTRIIVTATSKSDNTLAQSGMVVLNPSGLASSPISASMGPSKAVEFQALTSGAPPSAPKSPGGAEPAPAPAAKVPEYDWVSSDPSVKVDPKEAGKAIVQSPTKVDFFKNVIITVMDKTDHTRQAASLVRLSPGELPIDEDLSEYELFRDKRLIMLVLLTGALGALLGASRSLANFVGNDAFVPRWTLYYLLRPSFGAGLALLVFFGYRIGAIAGVKGAAPADPFTATFMAGLVGLFADTVLQKLKDVITALFPTQDERKDKVTGLIEIPTIESVEASAATKQMKIKGKNFASGATVTVTGKARPVTFGSVNELTVALDASDVPGDVKVVVTNPDKQASSEFPAKISA